MPLLNYTTKVSVDRTISDITKALTKQGATKVMSDFEAGEVSALSFQIVLNGQPINFRLPIDVHSTAQVLKNDRVYRDDAHARRVAWRITKDWVEAQMALLATKSVTLPQLFLPYAVDNRGVTLFEKVAARPELLLGGGE